MIKGKMQMEWMNYESGYEDGYLDGYILGMAKAVKDFIDFVKQNGTNKEILNDDDLKDFLHKQFECYMRSK